MLRLEEAAEKQEEEGEEEENGDETKVGEEKLNPSLEEELQGRGATLDVSGMEAPVIKKVWMSLTVLVVEMLPEVVMVAVAEVVGMVAL